MNTQKLFLSLNLMFLLFIPVVQAEVENIKTTTLSKENPAATFRCRAPSQYDQTSKTKYRLLIYFGGRNTTGENEIKNPVWTNWCDKNGIFLIVPSYKDDNYWEPQKWSGKALLEAIAQLKGKYPNICADKFLFYGYSAGAQCSNLFAAWLPEKTRAYVSHACGVFHKPSGKMKGIAALLTCGDADRQRMVINRRFIETYRKLGVNVLWKSYPNHPHDVPQGSTYLAQEFLEYYHKLYLCDLDASKPKPKENLKPILAGDDQDGEIYPADSNAAKQIYEEDRVLFTSEEIAKAWAKSAAMP